MPPLQREQFQSDIFYSWNHRAANNLCNNLKFKPSKVVASPSPVLFSVAAVITKIYAEAAKNLFICSAIAASQQSFRRRSSSNLHNTRKHSWSTVKMSLWNMLFCHLWLLWFLIDMITTALCSRGPPRYSSHLNEPLSHCSETYRLHCSDFDEWAALLFYLADNDYPISCYINLRPHP